MERIKTIPGLCSALFLVVVCVITRQQQQQYERIFGVSAFSSQIDLGGSSTRTRSAFHQQQQQQKRHASSRSASALASSPGDFGELTSALATMDQQWQIQQKSSGADKPKWSKLMLPEESDEKINNEADFPQVNVNLGIDDDFVWMLEPPNNSIPSCVVVFTGGAGLGQFPQVAYNELLSEVSKNLNAVCLTAPYEVGLDHFSLAKKTGEKLRRALLVLNEKQDENAQPNLPAYSLAHSLGCKLQTIYLAATGLETSFAGVGYLAYNNFSFARTISMARTFAQELKSGGAEAGAGNPMGNVNPEMINTIFDFAEMAVGAMGVEFSPTPEDTERLIKMRYNENLQAKTRVFVFGDDQLDSSPEFKSACDSFGNDSNSNSDDASNYNNNNNNNNALQVSNLDGGHLTPVFFRWNADDLAEEAMGGFGDSVSQENINMAKEAIGGFQGASFGDETAFGELVDEVCDWILGKPPRMVPMPQISSERQ